MQTFEYSFGRRVMSQCCGGLKIRIAVLCELCAFARKKAGFHAKPQRLQRKDKAEKEERKKIRTTSERRTYGCRSVRSAEICGRLSGGYSTLLMAATMDAAMGSKWVEDGNLFWIRFYKKRGGTNAF